MFRKKPIQLNVQPARLVPDSPSTTAARANLNRARQALEATRGALEPLNAEAEIAEAALKDAAAFRYGIEERLVRHAQGQGNTAPSAQELADAVAVHAKQAKETEETAQRASRERGRINGEIERLTREVGEIERAIAQCEFQDVLLAYRDAIGPAIPLAREVRRVAAMLHKDCSREKALLDPDADYGRLLFGAYI